jgi:hypothetical protein
MIPNASPETPPVRPSRVAAVQAAPIERTPQAATTAAPGPAPRPQVGRPPYQAPDPDGRRASHPVRPDMRSAQGLAQVQAVHARSDAPTQETPESRRANVRAHVTRRLTALQSMDASMQAALMRIGQMRQLAMRSGKPRPEGDAHPTSEGPGRGPSALAGGPPTEPTLSSVFADLEKDIEQLVMGQLGGFIAAEREIDARSEGDEREPGSGGRGRQARGKTPETSARSERDGSPAARQLKGRPKAASATGSQRVQLQVAGASAADVSTGPLAVSGDLGSEEGAAALLADLELLAQQIAGARASIQAAVNRLQRDATQGEPPPIRTLGARRRGTPTESNPASDQVKGRKSRPEDPIAVVRARLAMAIAAQANASPEAAMRLL